MHAHTHNDTTPAGSKVSIPWGHSENSHSGKEMSDLKLTLHSFKKVLSPYDATTILDRLN